MAFKIKYLILFALSLLTTNRALSQITTEQLSKNWVFEKYTYLIFSEALGENEQNDYILLKENGSFESVSEGVYDSGNWCLDAQEKKIYLTEETGGEALVFIIYKLKRNSLILMIDDPSDSDAPYLKIHFKTKKQ